MPATILIYTDPNMLAAAQTLVYSLRKNGNIGDTPIRITSMAHAVLTDPILAELGVKFELIRRDAYSFLTRQYLKTRWGVHTFIKGFETFTDWGADVNITIDADMLCLGDISELLIPPENPWSLGVVTDGGVRMQKFKKPEFNGGLLVCGKNLMQPATRQDLIFATRARLSYDKGDQGVLNRWAHDKAVVLRWLPYKYNYFRYAWTMTKKTKKHFRRVFEQARNDVRLLHFLGPRPWTQTPPYSETDATALWWTYRDELLSSTRTNG